MSRTITLIPGDGIGPEISAAMMRVVDATGVGIEWDVQQAGLSALEKTGQLMSARVKQSIRRNRVAIKGPLTTPIGGGHRSLNVQLRQEYQLYANIRPIQLIPGVASRYAGERMNMVIFRESTEDLYAGIEHVIVPGVVESIKIVTEKASSRIANMAFKYAQRRGRRKVTAVHKANIMKLADGLFLNCCRKVAKRFPQIEYEEMIVDNCSMQVVMNPSRFDVILLPNLYGDILSDLCAGLVGGLGVTPGANVGDRYAIFEAVHGSAPDIAGKGIANPTALILSAAMMLRHLDRDDEAFLLRKAVAEVVSRGAPLTRDLGGTATTAEYGDALVQEVGRLRKQGPDAYWPELTERRAAPRGGASKAPAGKKAQVAVPRTSKKTSATEKSPNARKKRSRAKTG
ncbi:MAG: isocitrate/isopropylmalate dehydrogenase family protein [Planctomycetota bacterium]